jgi:hypothetical protein
MASRKIESRTIRKLTRTGNDRSISLTLPIEYVRELGWQDKQKVRVSKHGKKLVIEDWKG